MDPVGRRVALGLRVVFGFGFGLVFGFGFGLRLGFAGTPPITFSSRPRYGPSDGTVG